jgi:glycosyltransferase involved in cell wall biosynthesis
MRERPLVTVVLASYNHARFVEEAVESVLNQTLRDLELVVVDDGSTDGTVERVQAIRDPRLSLYQNSSNRGRHSRNWAIARTHGTFVAIQNSDDRWHPDKLAQQLQFLEEHPNHGLCFTAVDVCDDSGSPCPEHPIFGELWRTEQHDRFGWLRRFFLMGNCLAHASVLMRRELLDEIGLYDPALFQLPDLDLWIRAAAVADLAVLPRALTTVRIHGGNLSSPSPAASQRHARELTEVLLRYGAPPILRDVARIFDLDRAGGEIDGADEVWHLARLGRYADARPEPHLRAPAIHFLREALRRSDERDVLPAEERGRLALDLVRASGRPSEPDAASGLSGRAGKIVESAVRAIGRTWR